MATAALSQTLAANNAQVLMDVGDVTAMSATLTGTFVGTITFQVLYDAAESWVAATCYTRAGATATNVLTAPGNRMIDTGGAMSVRALMNPYTSGTAEVTFAGVGGGFMPGARVAAAGGGGGGPVTIVDGGDVTQGTTTDLAAASDTGAATIVSLWKRLLAKFTAGLFVQGMAAAGTALTGNPVLIAGTDGTAARNLATDALGRVLIVGQGSPFGNSDGLSGSYASPVVGTYNLLYNAATWDRQRQAVIYKVLALASGTAETTIWTPAAGKKFRLMGFLLSPGAATTLTFKDNTGGTTIFAAHGPIDTPILFTPASSNGILSAAANNPLTVTRSIAATLDGTVYGTEE
jgi:hypothetical protein